MQQQELFIDIEDKSSDNPISERINNLIDSGYKLVKLGIRSTFQKKENEIELDLIQFKKIKEIQDLPDWVIIKLILAAGSLRESSFKDRFLND